MRAGGHIAVWPVCQNCRGLAGEYVYSAGVFQKLIEGTVSGT